MSYEVAIIADSISPARARITTFQLKYPRMVHAEVMTHRMFSRNASSTRAIPTAKMIEWVQCDPAMPVYWGKNQKGMQATEELSVAKQASAGFEWLRARDRAVEHAKGLMDLGIHKQIASRILEPWAHINVVLTATSFDNFFALRCHPAAMPEIQVLAVKMARAYRDNTPNCLDPGEWHLPYVTVQERTKFYSDDQRLAFSVARCARVSYRTFEGNVPDPEADIRLHDQLRDNGHWSPFEHQASALTWPNDRSGNLAGWDQYRQVLPKGVHKSFDMATLEQFGDRDFIV